MAEFIRNANIDMQAVILAGGRGNRMNEKTYEQQKCMLEVDGSPILEHILTGLKETFGKKVEVIIATGYKGENVRKYFGDSFQGLKITHVYDDRPLETKGRLLLAKDILIKPFFFLAGDILTASDVLENIATRFEQEQVKKSQNVIGVISGAEDHTPAPTHAVLSVHDGYLQDIQHPPPKRFRKDTLRETHRAIYSVDSLELSRQSDEQLLSRIIKEIITHTDMKFGVERLEGVWGHYAEPEDLQKYKNLPFLRKK